MLRTVRARELAENLQVLVHEFPSERLRWLLAKRSPLQSGVSATTQNAQR
ncbi:MAG: hypothetical protein VKL60_18910 [Sphaerospermopsis sp.]|nr:hypothetical protein [Sphaerospermopsis sp.]